MDQKQKINTELKASKTSILLKLIKPSRAQLVSGAMMLTAGALAIAAAPTLFTTGTTLSSSAMNDNFSGIDTRITALETVPAFQAPTLSSDWSNVGSQWATAGFTKDAMGFVHFRGLVKRAVAGTQTQIFTLPAGYRPAATLVFPVRCGDNTMCFLQVFQNGNVEYGGGADANSPSYSLTLDGIVFDLR